MSLVHTGIFVPFLGCKKTIRSISQMPEHFLDFDPLLCRPDRRTGLYIPNRTLEQCTQGNEVLGVLVKMIQRISNVNRVIATYHLGHKWIKARLTNSFCAVSKAQGKIEFYQIRLNILIQPRFNILL